MPFQSPPRLRKMAITHVIISNITMKIYPVLCIPIIRNAFALPPTVDGAPNLNRGFGGLLGDDQPLWPPTTIPLSKTTHGTQITHPSGNGLGSILADVTETSGTPTTTPLPALSIVGTPDNGTTSAQSLPTVSTAATSAATATGLPSPSADEFSSESKTWKIIGVSVIAVTFVVGTIFLVVFFDQWWRFLRDMVLGKNRTTCFEDLVPDWEKRSWEVRLAEEEGHRYPSIPSNALVRQPSARHQNDDPRHPFPTRPSPHTTPGGAGLGFCPDDHQPLDTLHGRERHLP